jgi:hypothetical protein
MSALPIFPKTLPELILERSDGLAELNAERALWNLPPLDRRTIERLRDILDSDRSLRTRLAIAEILFSTATMKPEMP